jgi:hypothetical protein
MMMNRIMKHSALISVLVFTASAAIADEPVNTAPPTPPSARDQETIEPEVTIIQREDKTIEEYRVNGQLYMIKVTPKNAPPYFLVDNDGNGSLESRRSGNELEPDIMIPQWVLFRW